MIRRLGSQREWDAGSADDGLEDAGGETFPHRDPGEGCVGRALVGFMT